MKYVFRLMILFALFISCNNAAENESKKDLSDHMVNKSMSMPYFAKLVFDKEKYVTRLVAYYYTLSTNGSFREGFIGF